MLRSESYILHYVEKHGGITYSFWRGRAHHKTGYYVSLKDYGNTLPLSMLTKEVIKDYIQDNYSILDLSSFYLGIWIDKDIAYLDISRWVKGKNNAIEFAKREEQKTIWDCKNQKALKAV